MTNGCAWCGRSLDDRPLSDLFWPAPGEVSIPHRSQLHWRCYEEWQTWLHYGGAAGVTWAQAWPIIWQDHPDRDLAGG